MRSRCSWPRAFMPLTVALCWQEVHINVHQSAYWIRIHIKDGGGAATYLVHHPKTAFVLVYGMKAKHSTYLMQVVTTSECLIQVVTTSECLIQVVTTSECLMQVVTTSECLMHIVTISNLQCIQCCILKCFMCT